MGTNGGSLAGRSVGNGGDSEGAAGSGVCASAMQGGNGASVDNINSCVSWGDGLVVEGGLEDGVIAGAHERSDVLMNEGCDNFNIDKEIDGLEHDPGNGSDDDSNIGKRVGSLGVRLSGSSRKALATARRIWMTLMHTVKVSLYERNAGRVNAEVLQTAVAHALSGERVLYLS